MSKSLQIAELRVEVEDFNGDFLILRSPGALGMGRLGKALFQRNFDFVDEVIATEVEVLLKLNALYSSSRLEELADLKLAGVKAAKSFDLPVLFEGGEDWERICSESGMKAGELVERLCRTSYSVAMLGFLPGFIYLDGLAKELQFPRKTTPAKYVEAGSVAIGGKYLGIYALDSPGGWHVIGRTPLRMLEIGKSPPVPFFPGDRFRLLPIDQAEYGRLHELSISLSDYHAPA